MSHRFTEEETRTVGGECRARRNLPVGPHRSTPPDFRERNGAAPPAVPVWLEVSQVPRGRRGAPRQRSGPRARALP